MGGEDFRSPGHKAYLDAQAQRVAIIREDLCRWFTKPTRLTLEIGCGHGHYLTAFAEAFPDTNCLGIDIVSKRISKAIEKRDKRNLTALQFLKAEIRECLMAWPEHIKLERIFILFPDPWPKKRHAKNRILQMELLDELIRRSDGDTLLHFRTDDTAHFEWGKEIINDHPNWIVCDEVPWPFENPSYFQDMFHSYQSLTASALPV